SFVVCRPTVGLVIGRAIRAVVDGPEFALCAWPVEPCSHRRVERVEIEKREIRIGRGEHTRHRTGWRVIERPCGEGAVRGQPDADGTKFSSEKIEAERVVVLAVSVCEMAPE